MDMKRIDDLLDELASSKIPDAPPAHAVLRKVRNLLASGAKPEYALPWLSMPQLAVGLACLALILGWASALLSTSSSRTDTLAELRDSLGLEAFDADYSPLPHRILLHP
tara:strand:- start:950 stop:1276 length:327 start_codon:yes stop_codon:yes gene_type:complete